MYGLFKLSNVNHPEKGLKIKYAITQKFVDKSNEFIYY